MKKYMLITRDGRTYSSGVVRGVFDGKQLAVDTYIAHLRLGWVDDNFLSIKNHYAQRSHNTRDKNAARPD